MPDTFSNKPRLAVSPASAVEMWDLEVAVSTAMAELYLNMNDRHVKYLLSKYDHEMFTGWSKHDRIKFAIGTLGLMVGGQRLRAFLVGYTPAYVLAGALIVTDPLSPLRVVVDHMEVAVLAEMIAIIHSRYIACSPEHGEADSLDQLASFGPMLNLTLFEDTAIRYILTRRYRILFPTTHRDPHDGTHERSGSASHSTDGG